MYNPPVDTKERLVESTRALLWERGYVGTSPKAIQERAGAGQGSMYHHFASKQELALAAIRRTAEELRTAADQQLSGPGSAAERITAYLRRERDGRAGGPVGGLPSGPDVLASTALAEPVQQSFGWRGARLADVVREGRDRGEFD